MSSSSAFRGALLGLASMAVFAANDNIIKALGTYNPFQVMFFSGIALVPLLLARVALDGQAASFRPKMPRLLALRCGVNVVNSLLVIYAFGHLPLAQAYAIFFTMPLLVTVMAALMLGEKVSPLRGAAVLAGFVGVLIALQPGRDPLTWGHASAVLGAVMASLNMVILRRTAQVERDAVNIIYPTLAQLTVAAIALPFVYAPMTMGDLGLTWAMAGLGFFGSFMMVAAYRIAPANVVSPMQYSQILWAALTSALIFDEAISSRTWAGLVVIIAAGLVILSSARTAPPTQSEQM